MLGTNILTVVFVFDVRHVLQTPKEEEMEVTQTTLLEKPVVTLDLADASSSTQTYPEEDLHNVCKTVTCDDDDNSEDSDR